MNKTCYRLVFHRARGVLVVVADIARAASKGRAASRAPCAQGVRRGYKLAALCVALGLVLGGMRRTEASVVADSQAPGSQQAQVLQTANGLEQVNIQTPSAAGVSHNLYSQFDVNQQGLILNNARQAAQTALGGLVAGNVNLRTGEATIILNEVTALNPSHLNGFIEIAGKKAELVIANPSGIQCNGCGFINANRATLTTGRPQMDQGTLKGFRVEQGDVLITGAGMDSSRQDKTAIIARAVTLNAGLWAQDLSVTTGRNVVDAANEKVVKLTEAPASAPELALDVASLGGMYAGKIRLVGTETGVGVHNAGHIGAQAGSVVLTADGRIDNRGTLSSTENLQLASQSDITNQGALFGTGDVLVNARGHIDNQGTVVSAQNLTLQGGGVNSHKGSVLAAGVKEDGSLGQAGNLRVSSTHDLMAHGQNLAAAQVHLQGQRLDIGESETRGAQVSLTADSGDLTTQKAHVEAKTALSLSTKGQLNNTGGVLTAEHLALSADSLINEAGQVVQRGHDALSLALQGELNNHAGHIATQSGEVWLSAAHINNQGGDIQHAGEGKLRVQTDLFEGTGGTLLSNGQLHLLGGDYRLDQGRTGATGLQVDAHRLSNRQGQLVQQGSGAVHLTLREDLDNQNGLIFSHGGTAVFAQTLNNQGGSLGAQGDLQLQAHAVNNGEGGLIQSAGRAQVSAAELDNQGGQVQVQGDLAVSATHLANRAGLLRSGAQVSLTADTLDNTETQGIDTGIEGQDLLLKVAQLNNERGHLLADNRLWLDSDGKLDNTQGDLSADWVRLRGDKLALRNRDGEVKAGHRLDIDTHSLTGDGKLLSLGDASLATHTDLDNQGDIIANGTLSVTSAGTLTNSGNLLSAQTLHLQAQSLTNQAQGVIRAALSSLSVVDSLTNYGVVDGIDTQVRASTLTNIGTGRLYGDRLSLQSETLNNLAENGTAAVLAGRVRVDIGTKTLNNSDHALIYSEGDLAFGGQLDDQHRATGRAQELNNHSADIEAGKDLWLSSDRINNINDHFATQLVTVSHGRVSQYQHSGSDQRYDEKDVQLHEDEVLILTTPSGEGDDFNHYDLTVTEEETRVSETDPAKLLAGGTVHIDTDHLLNDKSQVIAGNRLVVEAGEVENVEVKGAHRTQETGTLTHYYRIKEKGTDSQGVDSSAYAPPTRIQSIQLKPSDWVEGGELEGRPIDLSPSGPQGTDTTLNQVGAVTTVVQKGDSATVVGIATPDTRLPDNSLFKPNLAVEGAYVIETDPRFTNHQQWLGSDYMQDAFMQDGDRALKRLGDGYYEQRLLRDQIISLTGQRYLDGYDNDEDEFKALMDAGIAVGRAYDLKPGIALSPEQIAALTQDIVWLVSLPVTLPDGRVEKVLVPQVYARLKPGDLSPAGALLSGRELDIKTTGVLRNEGTLLGRQQVKLDTGRFSNEVGVVQGGDVRVHADTDIDNLGGQLVADRALVLDAGRDIHLRSTTATATHQVGDNRFSRTDRAALAGLEVTGEDGRLALQAKDDIVLTGAQVVNDGRHGQTTVTAGHNLTLDTLTTASEDRVNWDADNRLSQTHRDVQGTTLAAQGSLSLVAGQDIQVQAGTLSAGGALSLNAGHDLHISQGDTQDSLEEHHKVTSHGAFSTTTLTTDDSLSRVRAKASQLDGDSVSLQAGNHLHLQGSDIAGTHSVSLAAKQDIQITAATESLNERHQRQEETSGLTATGGLGFSLGSQSLKTTDSAQGRTQRGSQVGSLEGDLSLSAGNHLNVAASDLLAGKDMALRGQDVSITAGDNHLRQTHEVEQKTSGFTVALSGAAGSALNNAVQTAQQAQDASTGRLAALQGTKAALLGVQAGQALEKDALNSTNPTNNNTIGVSLSYGSQSSSSSQEITQKTQSGSTLTAGHNLSLTATGDKANNQGNLLVQGSQLQADNTIRLTANNTLSLQSSQDSQTLRGENESHGSRVGVGLTAGSGGMGVSVSASVNKGQGQEAGTSVTHNETTLNAGNQVSLTSGQDTLLQGSQVSGQHITADIGGNLLLKSEQDSDNYDSDQKHASAGVSVSSTMASASLNLSQDKMNSAYTSVQEQTGLFAGSQGYDLHVGKHTQLDGAVIASTGTPDKNRLDTGTLGFSDLHNEADFKTEHEAVGISTGGSIGSQFVGNAANSLLSGANHEGHDESTTKSAISEGTLTIRDKARQTQDSGELSHDVAGANPGLGVIFDKGAEQQRQQEAQLIAEIGNQVSDIARTQGDIVATKAGKEALAKQGISEPKDGDKDAWTTYNAQLTNTEGYKAAQQQWGTGSQVQKAIQGATAALQGLAGGDITKALTGAANPYLATTIKNVVGEDNPAANAMAHAVLGAVVAQINGHSALAGAAGAAGGELAAQLIANQLYPDTNASDLTETQKQTVTALATVAAGLAGGLAGGDTANAIAGAQAGNNAVENNFLGAVAGGAAASGSAAVTGAVGHGSQESGQRDDDADMGGGGCEGTREQCAVRDPSRDGSRGPGHVLNDDGSSQDSPPNVAGNLTDAEKTELGGAGSGTPGGWGPQDEENARNSEQKTTVDDLMSSSSKGQETTGRSKLFERSGGSEAANKEFDLLKPTEIKDIPGGRVGKLPDGRTVVVRERSTDGRPTLEIQSGKNRIKFRYDE